MNSSIVAFLPCRKGSQRVVGKNVRDFAGIDGGLLKIKLDQLVRCASISEIVVSTDDPKVISIVEDFKCCSDKSIRIDVRPDYLASSETKIADLVTYVAKLIPSVNILWVHVTEPFADEQTYESAIGLYTNKVIRGKYDSLFSVSRVQSFLWDENGPFNYDATIDRWPRTQDIKPLFEVNCVLFMIPSALMLKTGDRVGINPYKMELEFPQTVDIDTEADFSMAETLWSCLKLQ